MEYLVPKPRPDWVIQTKKQGLDKLHSGPKRYTRGCPWEVGETITRAGGEAISGTTFVSDLRDVI